ncbi:MAG: DOMON domain-containing protein, partial [Limisphaerales bacterium]
MKLLTASLAGVCATFLLTSASSQAGTFKRIVIDGSFDDWAGVPVLATDDEDAPESFDFRDVYVANDEEYLYLSATLYAPADYASFNHQVIIDTDQDPGTGHPWAGVGSEF